tara:strand:- start:1140 stop:1358 length:219 start_codon:yes stop_codon:yes gene_type:complete
MSTELMTAKNSSGTISMTGYHRDKQRRYQITVVGQTGLDITKTVYLEVDAETIANMQRCVDEYRELYPDSED